MNKRNFGGLETPISEVGLGCWQFGGDFGPMTDECAHQIMAAAVADGVDFFDTADVYGAGKSENLIGEFLRRHPGNEVKVVTKFGRDGDVFPDKYSEDALRSGIQSSCQRLGVEALDCVQLHCVP